MLKGFIPPIILKLKRNLDEKRKHKIEMNLYSDLKENVNEFVRAFREIPDDLIYNELFMEKFITEKAGLNNEMLHEQPPELNQYFGTGLYLWQNPKQFSKYIVWLMKNAITCSSYLEIGCRWGGTFIVVCEALHRASKNFRQAIAADIIERTPFIERYIEIAESNGLEINYFQGSSQSEEFIKLIKEKKPDISFIDGDHRLLGALKDHMLVRNSSNIIIHHDVYSDACPETTFLWDTLKKLETSKRNIEFIDQYLSVKGKFLGIGILY
jgi:hypothetical protein